MRESEETILDAIAAKTKIRVAKAKEALSAEQIEKQAEALLSKESGNTAGAAKDTLSAFERALSAPGISFICEVKKASPSKGVIADDFPYLEIAREYEAAGAAAVSVLTEPEYFLGADSYLREISSAISIPTLRKDFIIDPYQIYEAKLLGAQAVLLICALLDRRTLQSYIRIADNITLSALVEIHNEAEAEQALEAGARIIGINNRNLKTFTVDSGLSIRLRNNIPEHILTVAESGVKTPEDIATLNRAKIDAVLIGESIMRSKNRKQFLAGLKASCG